VKNQSGLIAYIALIGALWFTISSVYLQFIRVDLDSESSQCHSLFNRIQKWDQLFWFDWKTEYICN